MVRQTTKRQGMRFATSKQERTNERKVEAPTHNNTIDSTEPQQQRTTSGRTPQFDTTSFVHGKFQIGIGKGCLRSGWDGGHRDQGTGLSWFHRRRRHTTTTPPRWRRIVLLSSSSWCCLGSRLHFGFWQKQR